MTIIDQLLALTHNANTRVETGLEQGQSIAIHEFENFRWLYTRDNCIQSILCLDAPEQLVLAHLKKMLVALLLIEEPLQILNLGFGGGSFERYFRANSRALSMTSVDNCAALVELVKRHLAIPLNWPVVIQDAEQFLTLRLQKFNLIICDIFNGMHHANCLNQQGFYRHAAQNLTNSGVMTINLAPRSDDELVNILRYARKAFNGVMLSKVDGQTNIVMLLSKIKLPTEKALNIRATAETARWQLDFSNMLHGFKRVP